VLGMGDFIGKIAKGYKADLVLLDLDHVNFGRSTTPPTRSCSPRTAAPSTRC
jgi:cytosine/adenosine deaminase-related metal-dependent hydrolase